MINVNRYLTTLELREYFHKLKKCVGYRPFRYRDLPDELKDMSKFRRITDNGIAKKVIKSGMCSTWILIY